MPTAVPSPQTTLVVLLGASEWPYSPDFPQSQAFTNAAGRLKAYFLDLQTFGLARENLLDLFDSDQSADDLDREIGQFLEQRLSRMKEVGLAARDLVVYFIGHGGFAGGDAEYYLAIRRTRAANPTASGIRIVSLAHTLKEQARYLRRIVILDCCFAGAAFRAFQAAPAQAAITQTLDAFKVPGKGEGIPGRGTSLLCSSRHNRPSLLLPDGSSTMFSQALLDALATGNPYQQGPLSLQDVSSLAEDVLRTLAAGDAPRPEVHSPDQSEGDIAQLPFFPNSASRDTRASVNSGISSEAENLPQPIIHGQPSRERSDLPSMQTQLSVGSAPLTSRDQPHSSFPRAFSSGSKPGGQAASIFSHRGILHGRGMLLLVLVFILLVGGIGSVLFKTVTTSNAHLQATATATAATQKCYMDVTANGVMFGFDATHSHFNPCEKILSPVTVPQLKQAWTYKTGGNITSSPAVANGVVYVGSDDHNLYAFDASTGAKLWTAPTGKIIHSSPAMANGVVYVGSDDSNLYAFNASTGAKLWTAPTTANISSSPIVAKVTINGTPTWVVYVGSDSRLYAFDASKGTFLWNASTGESIRDSPAVANGVVYVGSYDHNLYAFDASKGTFLWKAPTGNIINSSPTVANGVVYIGSGDSRLYAFRAAGCGQLKLCTKPLWTASTGGPIWSSPAVANGVVYVGSFDHMLYAFHLPSTGE